MSRTGAVRIVLALSAAVAAVPAGADEFRVGPGGDFTTLQDAIVAALTAPGDHEIKVAGGTYVERLDIRYGDAPRPLDLRISGGWNAPLYTGRDDDPGSTIVSAAGDGRPLALLCAAGRFEVEGFTFRDGVVDEQGPFWAFGGGVYLDLQGNCWTSFRNNVIRNNRAVERNASLGRGIGGGGLYASVVLDAGLEVRGNLVADNEAASADHARAGGAEFSAGVGGRLDVFANRFVGNAVRAPLQANGSGVFLRLAEITRAEFSDNQVLNGTAEGGQVVYNAASFVAEEGSFARLTMRRNRFSGNAGGDAWAPQLFVQPSGESRVVLTDTLVSDAPAGGGVALDARGAALLYATNLTIAGNAGPGLQAGETEAANVYVSNSISFGNGIADEIGPGVERRAYSTIDPLFVNAARGDYHLRLDSPAIDAGVSSPPGDLGPIDLDQRPRIRGASVDLGAYEVDTGRGSCQIRGFGPVPPVDPSAPVCSCLRDEVLRSLRCGGLGADFFFDARVPPLPEPWRQGESRVRFHPWGLDDADYELGAEVLSGNQVYLAEIVGPGTGKIKKKDVDAVVRFPVPDRPATLRVTLRFLPAGETEPRESYFDVLVEPETSGQ